MTRLSNDPRLYLVSPGKMKAGPLAELVPELVAAGVDLIQLREKGLEAAEIIEIASPIIEACREAGIPFIINDRADIALAVGADGVHLGRADLEPSVARRIVPDAIVGRSNHSREDIAASLAEDIDYLAVGPVYETPTKPGRPAAGLGTIAEAAETIPVGLPWFAIGGIDESTLADVMGAGATRIVVVRALTESLDPVAVARRLKAALT